MLCRDWPYGTDSMLVNDLQSIRLASHDVNRMEGLSYHVRWHRLRLDCFKARFPDGWHGSVEPVFGFRCNMRNVHSLVPN